MRILAVTNMYPTEFTPTHGTFIEQQVLGLREVGVNVTVHVEDREGGGYGTYVGMQRRLRSIIESSKPDLVHSMYGGIMAAMAARASKEVPFVVSFCGSDLLGELLSGPVRKAISGLGVWASWYAARHASGIITKSRNLERALPPDVPRSLVRIIPNGISLERFKPLDAEACRRELGWNAGAFHVLFPTNGGDPRKRLPLAQAAVARARSLGMSVELHELRGVPHSEVPRWLNASHAVLLTSLHEGSPNVIKEALACDVPIVSVDVGDVAERVEGITGCYIAPPDPQRLAECLHRVQSGPARVEGRVAMEELTLERVAFKVRDLYQAVLDRRLTAGN